MVPAALSRWNRLGRGPRAGLIIAAAYAFLRLFAVPPILDGVQFSKVYLDRHGRLLRLALTPDEKYREFVPLSAMSDGIKRATLLYEDKWFYFHPGVNPVALASAAARMLGSRRRVGASTITMQVARMAHGLDTKTIPGKLKQLVLALYLELFHSKAEILEAYLNLAPYGGNIEGVGAASRIYFGRPAGEVSKIEAITIATIPQNPVKRSLLSRAGLANMQRMRADLAKRWTAGHPSDANIETLAAMPISAGSIATLPFLAPHFVDGMFHSAAVRYRSRDDYRSSIVATTLDYGLQARLESVLAGYVADRRQYGVSNASALLVDFKSMEVLAYVGSNGYFDRDISGQVDGVAARRSPGSLLKPFIYALAVEDGLIHPMSMLKDARISFGTYSPENSDSEFYGPILAAQALVKSRNIPAIGLLNAIGIGRFLDFLEAGGVAGLSGAWRYGVSIAMGGAEATMMEIAGLYAMLANLGEPHDVRKTLEAPKKTRARMLSREAAFLVLDMLGNNAAPSSAVPYAKPRPGGARHYYKTGTSSSYRDAWSAGVFGSYVLVVWIGNFDGTPNNHFSGPRAAAPLYFALANTVQDYYRPVYDHDFLRPGMNISIVDMCDGVGDLPGRFCPKVAPSYFIPGKSPIKVSDVHRPVAINKKTGLRSCSYSPLRDRIEVFEFWEPEYLDMFAKAGVKKRTPPPFEAGCDIVDVDAGHSAPIVVSPVERTQIVLDGNGMTAFKALAAMPGAKIFWFLDGGFIGSSKSDEVLLHRVASGAHSARATDEFGKSAQVRFSVGEGDFTAGP